MSALLTKRVWSSVRRGSTVTELSRELSEAKVNQHQSVSVSWAGSLFKTKSQVKLDEERTFIDYYFEWVIPQMPYAGDIEFRWISHL